LYSVKLDLGGCLATTNIDLQEVQFTSSINVSGTITIDEGETQTIVTTTAAENPSYQWYLNDILITAASGATFDANAAGDYKVIITQNTACAIAKEYLFTIEYSIVDTNVVSIPNFISPNGDGINDMWIIPQEYTGGSNTEVLLMSASGKQVLKTNNYQNNWPENSLDFKNINPVYYYIITTQNNKVLKGSITVIK